MRAAVGIDVLRVVGKAEVARDRERLRGKRFVELDHVHVADRQPGLGQQLARRRRRPEAHDARRHARDRARDDARAAPEPVLRGGRLRSEQHCARAVVHARGIAGRHGAVRPHDALELRERIERRRARMLVLLEHDGFALLRGDR